jgi:hypothetical protein
LKIVWPLNAGNPAYPLKINYQAVALCIHIRRDVMRDPSRRVTEANALIKSGTDYPASVFRSC